MKRSFVLWAGSLEKLIEDDSIVNIILGTGTLARDMQTKLKLLNLKAPILVGNKHDPDNGIWHYESLTHIENPKNCRYIACFDTDEWTLISPTLSLVYKILGLAMWNHPNVLRYFVGHIWEERAGKLFIDMNIQDTYLHKGLPYTILGDSNDTTSLKIHLFGACTVSGIFKALENTVPELLYDKLCRAGFNSTVYLWGHPSRTTEDNLILFLRDGVSHKPDHVILFTHMLRSTNPASIAKKNALATRIGVNVHKTTIKIMNAHTDKINNGIHHDVELDFIKSVQNKTFLVLAKLFGFVFWNVIPPANQLLSEKQSRQLLGLSPGYLKRARERKDNFINALNSNCVRDYTGIFDNEEDIFSLCADSIHWTDKGIDIIAQKLADDVLAEFSSYKK